MMAQHLLVSTAFTIAIAIVMAMLKRQSASVRYRLWLLAALKFAIPTSFFTTLGIWLYHTVFPTNSLLNSVPYFHASEVLRHSAYLLPTAAGVNPSFHLVLNSLWCFGALFCFCAWFVKQKRQNCRTIEPPVLAVQLVSKLRSQMGLHRTIGVRSASSEGELALSGIFKSVIVLPQGICEALETKEFEAVLMHELVHAKHWDNLVAVVVRTLVCCFWFHPGLWWIERRLGVERELACDEAVVNGGCPANTYVAGILKICRFHFAEFQPGTCGVSGTGLQGRMERIMSYQPVISSVRSTSAVIGFMGALVTLAPFLIGFSEAPALYGQSVRKQNTSKTKAPVSCMFAGKLYFEGSVIEEKSSHLQQLCVASFGKPLWVRTNPDMHERGHSVTEVTIPKPRAPSICVPKASTSKKLCFCEGDVIYSLGSIVDSPSGKLSCSAGVWTGFKASDRK